jgi:hypothetical protein
MNDLKSQERAITVQRGAMLLEDLATLLDLLSQSPLVSARHDHSADAVIWTSCPAARCLQEHATRLQRGAALPLCWK